MECKELEAVLMEEGLVPVPPEARDHLAVCPACQCLVADLTDIVIAARRIPAEVDPPDRIWVSLRSQLEAEGIIREPRVTESAPAGSWWSGFAQMVRPRVLGTVAATLFLLAGSIYVVQRLGTPPNRTTRNSSPPQTHAADTAKNDLAAPAQPGPVTSTKSQPAPVQSARVAAPPQPRESHIELKPSPSEVAGFAGSAAVLSETESALPSQELANNAAVDASLRQNLRTLNEFIAECEARLKQNPQDQLTREYLNMAYQQKAELLTAMMDSGRSEH